MDSVKVSSLGSFAWYREREREIESHEHGITLNHVPLVPPMR
jgi:hypothetical protein